MIPGFVGLGAKIGGVSAAAAAGTGAALLSPVTLANVGLTGAALIPLAVAEQQGRRRRRRRRSLNSAEDKDLEDGKKEEHKDHEHHVKDDDGDDDSLTPRSRERRLAIIGPILSAIFSPLAAVNMGITAVGLIPLAVHEQRAIQAQQQQQQAQLEQQQQQQHGAGRTRRRRSATVSSRDPRHLLSFFPFILPPAVYANVASLIASDRQPLPTAQKNETVGGGGGEGQEEEEKPSSRQRRSYYPYLYTLPVPKFTPLPSLSHIPFNPWTGHHSPYGINGAFDGGLLPAVARPDAGGAVVAAAAIPDTLERVLNGTSAPAAAAATANIVGGK